MFQIEIRRDVVKWGVWKTYLRRHCGEGNLPKFRTGWSGSLHISRGMTHCETCLKLDKCWFVDENKPLLPQHPHCHCTVEPISFSRILNETTAECRLSKFNPYLFDPEGVYDHGKGKLFESWGYSITDSEWLRKEFERQALEKYVAGQYTLGKLDKRGQRINITIELQRKDREGSVSFNSGWMVYPYGSITLNTPYGGK